MGLQNKHSILVVCMGNICRSPTAEAILRKKAQEQEVDVLIDSAGTIDFHHGEKPDARARAAGAKRGYNFDGITARQVMADDFAEFDIILAADEANLRDLQRLCPREYQHKLSLFLSHSRQQEYQEIPDPYYGGENGFELVLDLIEDAADSLINALKG